MSATPLLNSQNQSAPEDFPLARPLVPGATLTVVDQDAIGWALKRLAARQKDYKIYKDYYDGDHRLVFATSEYRQAFKTLLEGLRANLCPSVVWALTDRLEVTGFAPHRNDTNTAAADAAWSLWQDNNLSDLENRLHDTAVAQGDAYLLVWPDDTGLPRFYLHDGLEVCHEHDHEKPEIITRAAKLWKEADSKRWRLNLYYPDRIEKYRTRDANPANLQANSFETYEVPGEAWPVDNPYNMVPIFHFPFMPDSHDHGRSELADVIPLQDALNKQLCDLVVASEFGAYFQRWAVGLEGEEDEQGNPKPLPFQAGIDRILTIPNPDAKFGQFTATDLANYTTTIDAWCSLIARIKGIPLHYFHMVGDFPSGESQKTAESRVVKRVEKTQRTFGASWAQALSFAVQVRPPGDDVEGRPQALTNVHITTVWENPATRVEAEEIELIATKREKLQISQAQAWREAGYSEEEIAAMQRENAAPPPQLPIQED